MADIKEDKFYHPRVPIKISDDDPIMLWIEKNCEDPLVWLTRLNGKKEKRGASVKGYNPNKTESFDEFADAPLICPKCGVCSLCRKR